MPHQHNTRKLVRSVTAGPNRVYWYCVLGIIGWAVLRALGVDKHAPPIQIGPFLGIVGVAIANLGVRTWASARRNKGGIGQHLYYRLGWVFVALDLLSLAAGLRFSGGLESAVWVMMFVVLAGETLLENRLEATITRSGACLAIFLGTVPSNNVDWPAYFLEMFVRMGLLIAVSSVVRRLREGSDRDRSEVANLRAELALAEQRASLAREIHDGVGNSLAAAVLRLELSARIREKTAGESDDAAQTFKEEAEVLRQAMNAVRDWTFLARPWTPDGELETEIERLARRTGLPITLTGAEVLQGVSDAVRLAVFRIAQESLTNAAKHAKEATEITATLTREPHVLTLTIQDDGPGFDTASEGTGVGLSSMRERAQGLGGTLLIESELGIGTRVTLRLPIG